MHHVWFIVVKDIKDVDKVLEPFSEDEFLETHRFDEEKDSYVDENGNPVSYCDRNRLFYDWYEVGGRRTGIITVKKWGEIIDEWFCIRGHDKLEENEWSAARKKDIEWFYRGKEKYPNGCMFLDIDGNLYLEPCKRIEWRYDMKAEERNQYEKEWKEEQEKLFDAIADDDILVVIDYHS